MKILVVDDREENRAILSAKLAAHGYVSETASNGLEGLAKLRRQHFDAVISDLMMPGMDGYQLTHAIRSDEATKDLPVVIYTSTYTEPQDEALARNLGANAFILKPAPDEKFFAVLTEAIARAAKGELPSRRVSQDELQHLRDYTARLIHKLEDKVEEVSRLNDTLEQRIAEATADLREANTELEAFVNSATHDLRAPLRAIEGFSAILLESEADASPEERRRLLERVAKSAAHMQQLIQDLLDYSRIKQRDIKLAAVDLHAVTKDACERISAEIAAAHAKIETAPGLPQVLGFGPVLTHAVANLVSNAIKFVPPGVQPQVAIGAESVDHKVRLTVRDNGIGIAAEDESRIFQVFERVHDSAQYPGTGIGLALVKRAVEKMGGELGFTSEPGVGSTFWIELPHAR